MRHLSAVAPAIGLAVAVLVAGCSPAGPATDPTAPAATPDATPLPESTGGTSPSSVGDDGDVRGDDTGGPGGPWLFVRPHRDVTADLIASIEAVEGVAEAAAPLREEVRLVDITDVDGQDLDGFPADHFALASVLVADGGLLDGAAPGEVRLTADGAALRGVAVGAIVRLGAHPGLRLSGVVNDPAAQPAEFVIHPDDATSVGVTSRDRMFVSLHADADADDVAEAVRDALGPQAFVRVRLPADDDGRPFVLSLTETKLRFGEFSFRDGDPNTREVVQDRAWVEEHISATTVALLGRIVCHRAILDDVRAAVDAIVEAGRSDELYSYSGCYNSRRISPDGPLSKHAWGIALDVNVDLSQPGGGPIPHPDVIAAFEQAGFRWGGEFPTPDNHHFEWVGPPRDSVEP